MKGFLTGLLVLSAAVSFAADETASQSLADARGKIGAAIADPDLLTATMKTLSAADQKTFVAEVNAAIDSMPGSAEVKAAASLNANSAAVRGAQKGNLLAVLAEVFATASPEALSVINERFASDLFNRAADGTTTYSDAEFAEIAKKTMAAVNERVADTDQPDVRSTFAMLMFLRSSNGTPKDLPDQLIETLPESAREIAKTEWIPSALGTSEGSTTSGSESNYESMLAAADAGRRPDYEFTLSVAGPQQFEALLGDLIGKNTAERVSSAAHTPVTDAVISPIQKVVPTLGGGAAGDEPGEAIRKFREPGGYQWQTTY